MRISQFTPKISRSVELPQAPWPLSRQFLKHQSPRWRRTAAHGRAIAGVRMSGALWTSAFTWRCATRGGKTCPLAKSFVGRMWQTPQAVGGRHTRVTDEDRALTCGGPVHGRPRRPLMPSNLGAHVAHNPEVAGSNPVLLTSPWVAGWRVHRKKGSHSHECGDAAAYRVGQRMESARSPRRYGRRWLDVSGQAVPCDA